MFILLLSLVALAMAEPPVGDSYLEAAQSGHDHVAHHQYLPPDLDVPSARTSKFTFNPNHISVPSAKEISQEYGSPRFREEISRAYGTPNARSSLASGYGAPNIRNSISQEYSAPSAHLSQGYGNSGLSQQYGAPASRNALSEDYGAPSQRSLLPQYGVPNVRSPLSEEYGAPSQRSSYNGRTPSVQKYGVQRFRSNQSPSVSQKYGVPYTKSDQYSTRDAFKSSFGKQSLSGIQHTQISSPESRTPDSYLSAQYGTPGERSSDYSQGFGRTLSTTYGAPRGSSPSGEYGAPESRIVDRTTNALASSYSAGRSFQSHDHEAATARATFPSQEYGSPRSDAASELGYSNARNALEDLLNQEPASYEFGYKVSDYASGSDFGHAESRQEDRAEGSYFVVLPDGTKQVVEYEADERGFRPRISVEAADSDGPY